MADARPLPGPARDLLDGAAVAHLVTLNPDGSPHITCVWVGLDGEDVVFASMYPWRKTTNLQRDPRAAISVEAPGFHAAGLREYLTIYGTAEVTEGGAYELLNKLAQRYLGPGADFPPPELRSLDGYVMRLRVERFGGVGPWKGDPPGLPKGYQENVPSVAAKGQ